MHADVSSCMEMYASLCITVEAGCEAVSPKQVYAGACRQDRLLQCRRELRGWLHAAELRSCFCVVLFLCFGICLAFIITQKQQGQY